MLAATIQRPRYSYVNTDLRVSNILNDAFFDISLENDSKDKNFGTKIWLNWESFGLKVKPSTVIQALGATNCPRLYIFWSVRRRPKLESPLPTTPRPFCCKPLFSPGCNFSIGADIRSTSVFVSSRVVHVPLSLTLPSFLPSFLLVDIVARIGVGVPR